MLKLERTSVDNHISVTFRNKEHLFTRQFLTALAIALAIHLTLILIFQISSLKTRKIEILPTEKKMQTCEFCLFDYLVDDSKPITKCPRCNSFNK